MNRRDAIRAILGGGAAVCGGWLAGCGERSAADGAPSGWKDALFWQPVGGGTVQCTLCPRQCVVADGQRGNCGVRANRGGRYYTLVHSWAAALNIDPIEKKPLFHYLPGSLAFSIGTAGCNLHCSDCQNWEISQCLPEQVDQRIALPPATVVSKAPQYGAKVIAYTYNEPVISYEYMRDTAQAGRQAGLKSVMISNGYINREPMLQLAPHLDAIKIDLKAFTEDFYRDYCGATLEPVKQTIKRVHALGKWLEIVCLVLPTINDDVQHIKDLSDWILRAVGPEVPVHFTRFTPAYKLTHLPPTPVPTLERCWQTARAEGLKYVYVGNAPGHTAENTFCASCGKVVVKRRGFTVEELHVKPNGACKFCGKKIPGVWS